MKVDFTEFVVKGLDGAAMQTDAPLHKTLANYMFERATNLDLVEAARALFQTGTMELTDSMYKSLLDMMGAKECTFFAFARQAIIAHLEDAKLRDKNDGK